MPLIILDRDGVINEDSDNYIKTVDEWIPIPGSIDAIARLSQAGWKIAVATNQSGIARGYFTLQTLKAMHKKMQNLVKEAGGVIDYITFCPAGPDDDNPCRKPLPGMFYEISEHFGIPLEGVPAVGDSLRDLQAAQSAGAAPALVRTGKGERTLAKGEGLEGIPVYDSLATFVDQCLAQR